LKGDFRALPKVYVDLMVIFHKIYKKLLNGIPNYIVFEVTAEKF